MNAYARLSLSLLLSLGLWIQTALGFLRGEVDPVAAGTRYAVALAVAWTGVAVLAQLVSGYTRHEELADADTEHEVTA